MIYNYPNTRATVHSAPACRFVPTAPGEGQRWIRRSAATFSTEIGRFIRQEHRFATKARLNDMWLVVDLRDTAFDLAVGAYVLRMLAERYTPFSRIRLQAHC